MTFFISFLMMMTVYSFIKNYYHFMNVLMVFECFILLIFFCLNFYQDLLFIIFFCVFAVCESALGLTLMIIMVRCSGSEYCSLKFLSC